MRETLPTTETTMNLLSLFLLLLCYAASAQQVLPTTTSVSGRAQPRDWVVAFTFEERQTASVKSISTTVSKSTLPIPPVKPALQTSITPLTAATSSINSSTLHDTVAENSTTLINTTEVPPTLQDLDVEIVSESSSTLTKSTSTPSSNIIYSSPPSTFSTQSPTPLISPSPPSAIPSTTATSTHTSNSTFHTTTPNTTSALPTTTDIVATTESTPDSTHTSNSTFHTTSTSALPTTTAIAATTESTPDSTNTSNSTFHTTSASSLPTTNVASTPDTTHTSNSTFHADFSLPATTQSSTEPIIAITPTLPLIVTVLTTVTDTVTSTVDHTVTDNVTFTETLQAVDQTITTAGIPVTITRTSTEISIQTVTTTSIEVQTVSTTSVRYLNYCDTEEESSSSATNESTVSETEITLPSDQALDLQENGTFWLEMQEGFQRLFESLSENNATTIRRRRRRQAPNIDASNFDVTIVGLRQRANNRSLAIAFEVFNRTSGRLLTAAQVSQLVNPTLLASFLGYPVTTTAPLTEVSQAVRADEVDTFLGSTVLAGWLGERSSRRTLVGILGALSVALLAVLLVAGVVCLTLRNAGAGRREKRMLKDSDCMTDVEFLRGGDQSPPCLVDIATQTPRAERRRGKIVERPGPVDDESESSQSSPIISSGSHRRRAVISLRRGVATTATQATPHMALEKEIVEKQQQPPQTSQSPAQPTTTAIDSDKASLIEHVTTREQTKKPVKMRRATPRRKRSPLEKTPPVDRESAARVNRAFDHVPEEDKDASFGDVAGRAREIVESIRSEIRKLQEEGD